MPRPPALDGLNTVQQKAVRHPDGALLLLAGAGSGKTRVVTHRIAHLLARGEAPRSILALTFTNRAAREMRERVQEILGDRRADGLIISTFHALGARFLRRHAEYFGRTRHFTIYDDDDQVRVIKAALAERDLKPRDVSPRQIRSAIDRAKNAGRCVEPADLPFEAIICGAEDVGARYERLLERADAFDFGDLIIRPAEILTASPELALEVRRRWRWILVDEFQDTNRAQFNWLQCLAPPGSNLFVVGDDDQSIYGWRGAEVENILHFPEIYSDAEVVRLEQNYRSTGHILDAANGVIAHNGRRLGKSLWTERDAGMRLELHEARDATEEGRWVAQQIVALGCEEGYAAGDVAVLFRTNALTLDVEQALRAASQPYVVVRGLSFYDRAEVRNALAWIRLLVNPADDVAFRRASAAPARGIGATSLRRLAESARDHDCSLWNALPRAVDGIRGRGRAGLRGLSDLVRSARADETRPPSRRARALLEGAGLLDDLRDRAASEDPTERNRLANVERLLDAIATYESDAREPSLAGYLEQVKLVSELDVAALDGGAVSLMTVHAAKGLEFPVVFVVGLEEGIFPHARSVDEGQIEEERRLFYVALTRARERLCLTRAVVRGGYAGQIAAGPSRFLRELPAQAVESRLVMEPTPPATRLRRRPREEPADELAQPPSYEGIDEPDVCYRVGMRVWHADLGAGEVVRVRGGRAPVLTVEFADVGRRTVVARFVSPYDG